MIGERLKSFRQSKGMNQSEFSKLLGISQGAYSSLESGGSFPSGETFANLYLHTDIDVAWLLTGEGEMLRCALPAPSAAADAQAEYLKPDRSEFLSLPLVDLKVAAGDGSSLDGREGVITTLAFRRDWLAHEGLHSSQLLLVRVDGDSMEPTIYDTGTILVDRSQAQIKNEKIYVFRYGSEGYVKRLRKVEDRIVVVSDNRAYPEWEAPLVETTVIGRVVWAARILR